ncbi:MAG: hypothetical protein ACO1SX_27190 [Actinomycetota bacterium]
MLDLEAIEERLKAASQGVCGYYESGYCNGKVYRLGIQFTERGGMRLGDAVFHSHAADDVKALVREVRDLRAFAASVQQEGAGRLD